jgi:membrane fusion protein (multidrug efflux system)
MSKTRVTLISLFVILALFFISYKIGFFSNDGSDKNSLATKIETQKSVPINVKIATPTSLKNKITITGTILANEAVDIATELSGKIEKIYFKEGANVRKGELLFTLNNDELSAQYDKLKFSKKLREDNEFRQRSLLKKEAISQSEYEIALTELNTSNADIKLVEAQLAKTSVRAPFDGVIGLRYTSEGAFVNSNSKIAYLANINPVKIEFSIPAKYSTGIKVGDEIDFYADGINKSFKGKVYAIDPQIDQSTRTMKLRAISENKEGTLLPGQFTKVELVLNSANDALMLPTESVIPELSGHKIFLYRNGYAKEKSVEIGLRTPSEIEITSGLNAGDTVIVSGILLIKQESPLEIITIN